MWFRNPFTFSNKDINKFILWLAKGVYPYEYIDDWEKFNEKSFPKKKFIVTKKWRILQI